MTTILEKLETLATIENARAWEKSPEQYLFCDNLISGADINPNPARIDVLEFLFSDILNKHATSGPLVQAFLEGNHAPSNKWP